MTGSPSAMTMSDPENTQSGRPMAMIAARATIRNATKAAAYTARRTQQHRPAAQQDPGNRGLLRRW
jgi:hypothetical protein